MPVSFASPVSDLDNCMLISGDAGCCEVLNFA